MRIQIKVDARSVVSGLRRVATGQLPYATSRALNDLARQVQQATPDVLQRDLDRPAPFTTAAYGMGIDRATKSRPTAVVGFKPAQSEYLAWQEEGGERRPKRKALRLPSEQPLDAFGNLPPRTIATLVARARAGRRLTKAQSRRLRVSRAVDLFYGEPGDGRPAGVYKRVPLPGSGDNRLIPLVVFPQQGAKYKPRLRWRAMARSVVERGSEAAFRRAIAEAMASAR